MARVIASTLALGALAWSASLHAVTLSPASGTQGVCTDVPLAIAFDHAPQVGSAGVIRVLRVDGTLADSVDLADPNSARKPIGGAVSGKRAGHVFAVSPPKKHMIGIGG